MKRRKQIGLIILIVVLLGSLVYFQSIQNIGSVEIKRWSILSESFTLEKFNITAPNHEEVKQIKDSIKEAKQHSVNENDFKQITSLPGAASITFTMDSNSNITYSIYYNGMMVIAEQLNDNTSSIHYYQNTEEIFELLKSHLIYKEPLNE